MRKRKDPESENLNLEESILIERLRSYRVPGMVEEYRKQLQDPIQTFFLSMNGLPGLLMPNGINVTTRS